MGMSTTTFAAVNKLTTMSIQVSNEYDYISMLKQSTTEELDEIGITREEADNIISEFNAALSKRATLSDTQLITYGYTTEEIDILRAYAKGTRVSDNSIRAITGTCTGNIKLTNCGTKYATFAYTWSWDHCPIMTLSDSAAMRWLAYDKKGYNFSVIRTNLTTTIDYYNGSTKQFTRSGKEEAGLELNTVNLQFDVTKSYQSSTTLTEEAYAKYGTVKVSVQVDNSVNNNINYIMVAGLYGHTTIGGAFPSVSLSPTGSVSISFSGNLSIDKIGAKKAKIGTGSTITYL